MFVGSVIVLGIAAAIAVATWSRARELERRLAAGARAAAGDAERSGVALAHERALTASVLGALSQGVVVLDGERHIAALNGAAQRLLELDDHAVGAAFLDRVRAPGLVALVESPRRAGTAEVELPSGARVAARAAPLDGVPGSGGARRGCVLVLDDVTAVRRLETVRKDFVANVSHELRTPVSIIRANAETLLGGALEEPRMATKLVDGLHRNAERLARILTDLLDLSRLDAGQYRIEAAPVDLAAAAEQAAEVVEPKATDKHIVIRRELDGGVTALGDAKALDQVLVNLLDNAVKYTQPGGRVWIHAERAGDRVRIEVADDGPGIAPRHRERIFERFYRVDPGRSREMGGTGLGLSIVKHLVESMGGSVGVEPNEPRGSRFWVELKAA